MAVSVAQIRALRELNRRAGLSVRRRRIPRQLQPDGVRLSYFTRLQIFLSAAKSLIRQQLLPLIPSLVADAARERGDSGRMDADPPGKRINILLDRVSEQFYDSMRPNQLEDLAEEYARRTSRHHREELQKQMRAGIGIEVPLRDAKVAPLISQFTSENVALIKSLPQKYFDDVEKKVISGINTGQRAEEIAKELEERFSVTESSAARIANDQVGKFFGKLNEVRQQELGIDAYIWRTSNDERVRAEHAEREGERYTWASPPADGHPGQPVNCRCYAEPDLSPLLSE